MVQGRGTLSQGTSLSGDQFVGKPSPFRLVMKVSLRFFFAQFGAQPALCASAVAAVARYCCSVVGNQAHPFFELVPPSLWRANLGPALFCLISVELVMLKIWARQSFTLTRNRGLGVPKFPVSRGAAPNWSCDESFPSQHGPLMKCEGFPSPL